MRRLTITLPDDLYSMAQAYAVANRKSMSKAIGDLLRERSSLSKPPAKPAHEADENTYFDPILGIRVSRCDKPLTEADIRRGLDDEDARHLEMMDLSPEEIERSRFQ